MRTPTTAKIAAPLLLSALLLPACSSSSDDTAPDDAARDSEAAPRNPTPSPTTPSPTPTPTPTHEPTPTPSESPPLPAEDGTDVEACRQADCEIYVEEAEIPLDPEFGFSLFVVSADPASNVMLVGTERPEFGEVGAIIEGTGYVSFANGVTVTVVAFGETGAVLRFESRATDPEDTVSGGDLSRLL
ncbi:hypothetical protein [Streptomyces sp. 6N223]|uniref:hypothetical protein n=1 Tax=Streptomyces sp. 6N223 TaxID=3457412 RepID=UPI003FD03FC8